MLVFRRGYTLYKHFNTTEGVRILFLKNKKVTATHAVFVVANTCWMLLIDSIFAPIDL